MTNLKLRNGNDLIIPDDDRDDYYIQAFGGNDTVIGNDGNDSIIGGKGNDSLKGGAGEDYFIYAEGDGKDIIADYEEGDVIQITRGDISKVSTNSKGNVVFKIGSGSITVKNAGKKIVTYIDAEGERHYYPVNIKGTTATLKKNYGKDEFIVSDFEDFAGTLKNIDASAVEHDLKIVGNKNSNKITGTDKNDTIDGGAGKDTLIGGKGNDSLNGGKGNDSLAGGVGEDYFIYAEGDGKDIITDYEEGDVIQVTRGEINKISTDSKGNVVFKIGSGSITLKNAKGKIITYIDADGEIYSYRPFKIDGGTVTLLENYTKDEFIVSEYEEFAGTLKNIDASAVTHDLKIVANKNANKIIGSDKNDTIDGDAGKDTLIGGAGNDTLVGGKGNDKLYGGAGNDCIKGGAGNDSLWGDDGKDKFFYAKGDGKDIIYGFENGDTLTLDGLDFTSSYNKSAGTVTLKFDDGSITFKEFTATTFHINNDTYKISGTKLVKS